MRRRREKKEWIRRGRWKCEGGVGEGGGGGRERRERQRKYRRRLIIYRYCIQYDIYLFFSEFITGAGLVDSLDPELHGFMSGSDFKTLGKKINQSKKNSIFLLLFTVFSLISKLDSAYTTYTTSFEYNKKNNSLSKNFYYAEYDPLMLTEDDVPETSDAEAMRILEEEDDADPAAAASAAAATTDPAAAQTCAAPASTGTGELLNESNDTMDTTDPASASMDPAHGSALFKTPEAPAAKALD
jgi:hypothetical protein